MSTSTPLLLGLSLVASKSLTPTFDVGAMSSDGGVIVLREIASRYGLAPWCPVFFAHLIRNNGPVGLVLVLAHART